MRVKNLIAYLQKFDPELQICIDGYEGGYHFLRQKDIHCEEMIVDHYKSGYYGPNESKRYLVEYLGVEEEIVSAPVKCIILGRSLSVINDEL